MLKLKPAGKLVISLAVLVSVAATTFLAPGLRSAIAPSRVVAQSMVPAQASLVDGSGPIVAPLPVAPAGCADQPEVRLYLWAWNAQQGLIYANGGKVAAEGSLMCGNGVNLQLIREDNVDAMQSAMVAFAEAYRKGDPNPSAGAHLVAIMGDGSASFLKGVNDQLRKLGPEYTAVVVGSAGYSRGEDKFMGPPAWKANPQAARGGVVAGYLRDGDWNIAMKWLGDNAIPNNPDETRYDPSALNWVAASDYIDAAQKYVSGFCTDLVNVQTHESERHCVDGVVTWTPGDVTVAHDKGGLVSIVSTKEYRSQMPNVLIGNKAWMAAHPELIEGLLKATFAGGDAVKTDDGARRRAAALSAQVYGEKDPGYWYQYFTVQAETDKQGLPVELGGSAVNNLADNLQLFGMSPGSADAFAATYTVFGDIVKQQYPDLMPSYDPVSSVFDPTYLRALAAGAEPGLPPADAPTFTPDRPVTEVVSRRAWQITFRSGSADFTAESQAELVHLFEDLVVADGVAVEIHGHTDDQGTLEQNQRLSERRAFAVERWLEGKAPTSFPHGRVRVFAHGMTEPVAPNDTADGRALNRRVEVVLGTSS